jgi:hypothetical protein
VDSVSPHEKKNTPLVTAQCVKTADADKRFKQFVAVDLKMGLKEGRISITGLH